MKAFAVLISFCMCGYGFLLDSPNPITAKNCGKSKYQPLIVGGYYTKRGSYPWMVSLRRKSKSGIFRHFCAGSILNENWIVTAAHCTKFPENPGMYEVVVGLYKLSEEDAETVQRHKIAKIVVHEDYDKKMFNNDIALLRTTKPINIVGSKGYVSGIKLTRSNDDPTGYARVIGWGYTKEGGKKSNILEEVVLPLIPRYWCLLAYGKNLLNGLDKINENMICAGVKGKDSCQSDSGGPLFQTNTMGVSTLIGIVSNGIGCGRKGYPGIYTKVSMYRDWIENIILN